MLCKVRALTGKQVSIESIEKNQDGSKFAPLSALPPPPPDRIGLTLAGITSGVQGTSPARPPLHCLDSSLAK